MEYSLALQVYLVCLYFEVDVHQLADVSFFPNTLTYRQSYPGFSSSVDVFIAFMLLTQASDL